MFTKTKPSTKQTVVRWPKRLFRSRSQARNLMIVAVVAVTVGFVGFFASTYHAHAAYLGSTSLQSVLAYDGNGGPNFSDKSCLDVDGNVNANGRKVQIWSCNGGDAQHWVFEHTPDYLTTGRLRIYGNKCLDVLNGSHTAGTPVQLYDCLGNTAQTWQIMADGSLLNPASGLCLDVRGGGTQPGTQAQIYYCNGGGAQKWFLTANTARPVRGFANSTSGVSKCLDIDRGINANMTKVQVWDCNGGVGQDWMFVPFAGRFTGALMDRSLGIPGTRCLDVSNGGTANGTKVWLWDCLQNGSQEWQVLPNGSLMNPQSGRCLDANGNSQNPGTQMQLWDCNGVAGQKWQPYIYNTSVYGIAGMCMDNVNFGAGNGNPVQLYYCNDSYAQRWAAVRYPNGNLTLRWDGVDGMSRAGLCLDIPGGSRQPGTLLQLWECNGGPSQEWQQSFSVLRNPNSGLCLQTQNLGSAAGTRLSIDICRSTPAQGWSFRNINGNL